MAGESYHLSGALRYVHKKVEQVVVVVHQV